MTGVQTCALPISGAERDEAGKVATADTGTLFLDEVGELPPHLQGSLLRLVETKTYERLGEPLERTADIRIVAATNRDLEEMVRDGSFRSDLFFRLSVLEIFLPPLRQRPEDVLLLARAALDRLQREHARELAGWTDEVEGFLLRHRWPGNVRELGNVIERAVLVASGAEITAEDLPDRLRRPPKAGGPAAEVEPLAVREERHIRRALDLGLSLERTAALLGIDPSTLWRKRKRYGL